MRAGVRAYGEGEDERKGLSKVRVRSYGECESEGEGPTVSVRVCDGYGAAMHNYATRVSVVGEKGSGSGSG